MTALLRYDIARQAVAEAKTFDEVRDWEDKAAAVREYSRRVGDRSMELDALEIRERARRRRGELILLLKSQGLIFSGNVKTEGRIDTNRITLDSLDVSRNESMRDQRIAGLSTDSFERLIARCRTYADEHPEHGGFNVLKAGQGSDKAAARSQREQVLGEKIAALPNQKFGVIVADPEWRFEPWSRQTGMDRAADNHYPTLCIEVIAARDVPSIAADDCALFLWATAPMLPHALAVMEAWGFAYKSNYVWAKDRIGTGYWNRNAHEHLLIGTKGRIPAPAMGTQWRSLIEAPVGKHSAKPELFLEMIEKYFPTLPKIELNRRGPARAGWSAWGNEAQQDCLDHAGAAEPIASSVTVPA